MRVDRRTIAVVDDDDMIVRLMERLLGGAGYRTVAAADGEAGLHCIRTEKPDLAVVDVMMPKMDGLALTRALRADEVTCAIPIILVSARALPADVAIGLEAGANRYLSKPFDVTELLDRVAELLA